MDFVKRWVPSMDLDKHTWRQYQYSSLQFSYTFLLTVLEGSPLPYRIKSCLTQIITEQILREEIKHLRQTILELERKLELAERKHEVLLTSLVHECKVAHGANFSVLLAQDSPEAMPALTNMVQPLDKVGGKTKEKKD